jgi:hypothetical protein
VKAQHHFSLEHYTEISQKTSYFSQNSKDLCPQPPKEENSEYHAKSDPSIHVNQG